MKYWFVLILVFLTLACKPPIGAHLKVVRSDPHSSWPTLVNYNGRWYKVKHTNTNKHYFIYYNTKIFIQ
jgi:hypothetical protein